jgi:hypothetical protein
MLIIGQPDKMLKDLRNSKGSTQLSAMSMWIVGSGENHVLNLVFSLCMSLCLVKVEDTASFIAPTAHTCCCSNHHLQPCHTTSSYGFQAFSNFTQTLFSTTAWLCSNILKPTLYFLFFICHLNRYMHHHSLAQAEPLLYGEI